MHLKAQEITDFLHTPALCAAIGLGTCVSHYLRVLVRAISGYKKTAEKRWGSGGMFWNLRVGVGMTELRQKQGTRIVTFIYPL